MKAEMNDVTTATPTVRRMVSLVLLTGLAIGGAVTMAAAQDTTDPCAGVTTRVVAEGLGSLENLEPDGTGGMLVSASTRNTIERILPDGTTQTLVEDVNAPGGLRVREDGAALWFNTGDAAASGVLGTDDGTLERFEFATGTREVITDGLVMPNGLVFDDVGNAYVSRDLGLDASITRIPATDRSAPESGWADVDDSNGLAIDPTGTFLYASSTFNAPASLFRIRLDDPTDIEEIHQFVTDGTIPAKGLDDLTIDAAGVLYLTANGSGELLRYDPSTDRVCVLTDDLMNPSAVKFGAGPGWPSTSLFVTGFDGRLVEVVLRTSAPSPEPVAPGATSPTPSAAATTTAPSPGTAPTPPDTAATGSALPATGGGIAVLALGVAILGPRRRHPDD